MTHPRLAAIHEERGERGSAIEALRTAVANERTHEEAHAGLMRLYAMNGDRQKALIPYDLGPAPKKKLDELTGDLQLVH